MAHNQILYTSIFLLSSIFVFSTIADDDFRCVYTIYVRTSKTLKAGTDSIISVVLYDDTGFAVLIKDLEKWGGLMGQGYDYYERGNLDIFSGRGPCFNSPVCSMELTSDGTGRHHGWYCNYVEVTITGPHIQCAQQLFTVEQWLATDRSPHELTAVRYNCNNRGVWQLTVSRWLLACLISWWLWLFFVWLLSQLKKSAVNGDVW